MRRVSRSCRGTRTVIPAVVLVVAVGVLVVVGAGCGRVGTSTRISARSLDFGRFAGYGQIGPVVRSVSATITVPQVVTARTQQAAAAATWIGAEALPFGEHAPFIQAGVEELPAGTKPKDSGYEVFWAAGANLLPKPLFFAHAGDRLSVSLKQSGGRWTVVAADGSRRRRIVTTQEGTARLRAALWWQENLAYNHPKWMVYPRITGVRFSNLSVNGRAPERQYLYPVWMSADPVLSSAAKTVVEPSAVNHDAFTLRPGRTMVSASVIRELRKLSPGYSAIREPTGQLAGATVTTPRTKLDIWASEMSASLRSYDRVLRRQPWPQGAQASVTALLGTLRDQLRLTRQLRHLPRSNLPGWQVRLNTSAAAAELAIADLLHSLHLPWQF